MDAEVFELINLREEVQRMRAALQPQLSVVKPVV